MEYADSIRGTYVSMDTDELINRAKSGTLTDEAQVIALQELEFRGINIHDLLDKSSPPASKNDFFWRCWHGKEKLWKAYWLLGILCNLIVKALTIPPSLLLQAALLVILGLPIYIFWWVSVWRCAFRTSHWGWAVLARCVVIINVFVLCFVVLKAFA